MNNQNKPMWEEEFDKRFGGVLEVAGDEPMDYYNGRVKDFIHETLAADRNSLIEKIEELSARMGKEKVNQSATETLIKRAYQEAIDDVLKLVRE